MIENKIKILSEYLSKQNNMTWKEKKAFNEVIEHCTSLENHYKNKIFFQDIILANNKIEELLLQVNQ